MLFVFFSRLVDALLLTSGADGTLAYSPISSCTSNPVFSSFQDTTAAAAEEEEEAIGLGQEKKGFYRLPLPIATFHRTEPNGDHYCYTIPLCVCYLLFFETSRAGQVRMARVLISVLSLYCCCRPTTTHRYFCIKRWKKNRLEKESSVWDDDERWWPHHAQDPHFLSLSLSVHRAPEYHTGPAYQSETSTTDTTIQSSGHMHIPCKMYTVHTPKILYKLCIYENKTSFLRWWYKSAHGLVGVVIECVSIRRTPRWIGKFKKKWKKNKKPIKRKDRQGQSHKFWKNMVRDRCCTETEKWREKGYGISLFLFLM